MKDASLALGSPGAVSVSGGTVVVAIHSPCNGATTTGGGERGATLVSPVVQIVFVNGSGVITVNVTMRCAREPCSSPLA